MPGMMAPAGGVWWGWLWMLLSWAVLVALVIGLVRLLWPPQGRGAGAGSVRDEALEVLRQRYARGELTREEFLRMEEDLRRSRGPAGAA